ncbi:MAG: protein-L-isoaspartate(D-aspartate) O-methyltransferase [Rhodocyclaceae bacterium]|nr:protein-L-isoaspartate(D-aspartate) O-methyltransferase [Rhodocyclaceae bacterium]
MNARQGEFSAQATRARSRMVARLREQGVRDEAVLRAMCAVPRHLFVDEALASRAYEDTALPLMRQQTISQPYVVARMLELLGSGGRALGKTLEVGAGCGYQAAILAQLAGEVYAVERIRQLLERAKENVRTLRLPNLRLKYADGSIGLAEAAPFDSIIMAAAASSIPPQLINQLADGGRLVLPLGQAEQRLVLVERNGNAFRESRFEAVRFVPLLTGTE